MTKHLLVIAVAACFATAGIVQAAPTSGGPAQGHPIGSSAQLSAVQRGALVAQLVRTWGPFVQQVHQTSVGAWANRMQATFSASTDSNLQRAAGMKTFQGMMDALTGIHLTDAQVTDSLATQAQVLKSGNRPALLGSTTADLVYNPLAPCRIADTRIVGGAISGGFFRAFHGYTSTNFATQGGNTSSNCGIPANPSALMLNITVAAASAPGYLTVFPFNTTRPLAANLNYASGATVGNEIAAKMTLGSTDEFSVYAFGTTDVVVDVVGYFMAPQATPEDCVRAHNTQDIAPGAFSSQFFITCPAGRTVTGGGCGNGSFSTDLNVTWSTRSYTDANQAWFCEAKNVGPATQTLQGDAICCTVPGR